MPDENLDVKQESVDTSTTEQVGTEQVVDESVDTTQQEQATKAPETTTENTDTQTVVGKPQVEAFDENGVPYKNRYFEYKRKNEELAERLPTLVEQAISKSMGQQQTQQYSVEQLEAFAEQTDNSAYKTWAKGEIRKLEKEEQAKVIRGEFEKIQKSQQAETTKKQSYQYVAQNYSEAFLKDNQGNVLGWNQNHPLTRMIGQLMENPDLKGRPDALIIASDIAYGRYARTQGANSQQKTQQLKREVRNLQKRTLVEGGGKESVSGVPAHRAAIDKLAQTGSIKDAQAAIGEIMKAKRASEE